MSAAARGAAAAVAVVALALAAIVAVELAGETGGDERWTLGRAELEAYVRRVEPIRLGVNRLLERADPILSAYADHRLTAAGARARMDSLERRFAAYAVRIAALRPVPDGLRSVQASYAHTYVLEDAYLSALASALPERDFADLPHTQSRQRAAIIAWRIHLQTQARRTGARLPRDLQVAGRGEIAPAPSGS